MPEFCSLQIHVNAQHTFFVNEETVSKFSGKLRKIINQEKRRSQIKNFGIQIDDFPGGPFGFELVSRFCYNNGSIKIRVSNVCLLHCCALFLEMTEQGNLLQQTQTFFEGMFYWSWNDIITCLKNCETFFAYAQHSSTALVQNLMCFLLAKIAQNSDLIASSPSSSSSSSSSPDTAAKTARPKNSRSNWWFHDLTILPPKMIENFVKTIGGYGSDKQQLSSHKVPPPLPEIIIYTAVHGVMNLMMAKKSWNSLSCRGLFSVMRVVVGGFGLSRNCRGGLERLIGGMLHEATLDDLLVCGQPSAAATVYDVNLVLRLVKVFVHQYYIFDDHDHHKKNVSFVAVQKKMSKVGALIDDYLGEIAPDHNLNISKFLAVAESLPDCARASFDGVYRAVDIYLESHPSLSLEERSRLSRCVNYEKLSLQACKDLAKNPRIPPRIAVQALVSQHPNIIAPPSPTTTTTKAAISNTRQMAGEEIEIHHHHEDMRLNLQRMQWRVVELEKECRQMKGQTSERRNTARTEAWPWGYVERRRRQQNDDNRLRRCMKTNAGGSRSILFSSILISLFLFSSAQSCNNYAFASNKVFSSCNDLPYLNSFLHWTYEKSSGTAQIAYRHTGITSSRWVAWAINPESKGMLPDPIAERDLRFAVLDLTATYSNSEIVIFATLKLPSNTTTVNQVWQDGPLSNDSPRSHDVSGPNIQSMATVNLLSGQSGTSGAANSKIKKKNIHGVLNAFSWGILMPVGILIARYVKVFEFADPAWFYLHATCQTSAYIIGVAGWATGLQLGKDSPGIQHTAHRTIGILIFSLATLQVFALLLRPKKEHKYRLYWNIYHHAIGYTVLVLSIINIFKGFDILNRSDDKWEKAYIVITGALAVIAIILEVYTWIVVVRRKKSADAEKLPHGMNRTNGFNGYGARTQNGV
ncbi:auxin-responsive family protein [Actinidia rufa]|uniref:Auxin-responsive family protein n=1 Tax=Actinidia rufa TaxID=165716 RepID=A0A7J0EZJ4_9ERIC|nr:auxin-responsive family protein [Actinidia rufa]